jgi:hypothetical protein
MALKRMILIDDNERYRIHIEIDCKTENEQLHDRPNEHEPNQIRVAPKLFEFFTKKKKNGAHQNCSKQFLHLIPANSNNPGGEDNHKKRFLPKDGHTRATKNDCPQDPKKIPSWIDIGNRLNKNRHIPNRKRETGKHESWQDRNECCKLKSRLLTVRNGRDPKPQSQPAENKYQRFQK